MNRSKLFFGTLVLLVSTLLAGCSHKPNKMDRVNSDMMTINAKVDRIGSEVNAMRSDVQMAKDEAARANQRLDNQVRSYRK